MFQPIRPVVSLFFNVVPLSFPWKENGDYFLCHFTVKKVYQSTKTNIILFWVKPTHTDLLQKKKKKKSFLLDGHYFSFLTFLRQLHNHSHLLQSIIWALVERMDHSKTQLSHSSDVTSHDCRQINGSAVWIFYQNTGRNGCQAICARRHPYTLRVSRFRF